MNFLTFLSARHLACLALMGVLACEAAAQAPSAEAAIGPTDAFVFLHLRPADLWKTDAAAKLRLQYPGEAAFTQRTLEAMFGLPIDEVESVSVFGNNVMSLAEVLGAASGKTPAKGPPPPPSDRPKARPLEKPKSPPIDGPKSPPFDGPKGPAEPFGKDKDFEPNGKKFDFGPGGPAAAPPPVEGVVLYITTVKPYERATLARAVLAADLVETKVDGKSYYHSKANARAIYFHNKTSFLLANSPATLAKALERPAQEKPTGPLAAALELAGKKHHLVVGLNFMEPSALEVKKELLREASNPFSQSPAWALVPLLEARSAAIALDFNKDVKLQTILAFPDAASAMKGADAADDGISLLRILGLGAANQKLGMQILDSAEPADLALSLQLVKQLQAAMRHAKTQRTQSNVELTLAMPLDIDEMRTTANKELKAMLGDPATQTARIRRRSVNNLKQIMLSMHAYYDVYGNKGFPAPAICSKTDGKPLLSWRVAILPFIEEGPLYNEFKLNEAWDSPHNIKLLSRMPKLYAPIGVKTKQPYTTFYQVFAGPGTVFESRLDPNSMHGAFGSKMTDVTDGTANTIAIAEAADAVLWTKPADLVYDAKKALPKIGGSQLPTGFNAAFADGTVRFISDRVDEKTIRALITRNGGEVFDFKGIEAP